MPLSFSYQIIFVPIRYVSFCDGPSHIGFSSPQSWSFPITFTHVTPHGTPNKPSSHLMCRNEHNTQETQDTNIHTLSRIRIFDPSNTATLNQRLKRHCHWDRLSWCYCKAPLLLCRSHAIGHSQLIRKISAVCEINVYLVCNISSLDNIMTQNNPI